MLNCDSIFRKEALEYKKNTWISEYATALPSVHTVLIKTSIAILFFLILVLFCNYSYKIKVNGSVFYRPSAFEIEFNHSGVVSEVLVTQGEYIKKDQVIAKIRNELNYNEGEINEQIEKNIYEQIELLQNRKMKINKEFSGKLLILEKRIKTIDDTSVTLKKIIESENKRLAILKSRVNEYKKLKQKGIVTNEEIIGRENDLFQAISNINALTLKGKDLLSNKLSLLSDKALLLSEWEMEKFKIENSLNVANNAKIKASANLELNITSSQGGKVSSIDIHTGQNVVAGNVAAVLLPESAVPAIVLLVPAQTLYYLKKGQDVKLKISSLPFDIFGNITGKIESISQSPDKLSAKEKHFRVIVTIDNKSTSIPVGVDVEAKIITLKRPIWKWLFIPLRA